MITDREFDSLIGELKQVNNWKDRKSFRVAFDSIMGTLLANRQVDKIQQLKYGWYEIYQNFGRERTDIERIAEYRLNNSVSKLIRR